MFCFLTLASYIMKFWQPQKPSQTLSISEKEDWPQLQDFPHALQGIWFELLLSYSCTELLECHLKHSPRDYISLWTQVLCLMKELSIQYSTQHCSTLSFSVIIEEMAPDCCIWGGGRCCNSLLLKKAVLARLSLYFRPM